MKKICTHIDKGYLSNGQDSVHGAPQQGLFMSAFANHVFLLISVFLGLFLSILGCF